MNRARTVASASNDKQIKSLLYKAEQQKDMIKNAVNRRDYRLALNLYYNTTRLLLRVIDIAEGHTISLKEQSVEELEGLRELVEIISQQYSRNPDQQMQFFLNRANQLYQQAQTDIETERYVLALAKIERAQNILERVTSGNLNGEQRMADRAKNELDILKDDIYRLKERIDTSQRPVLHELLEAAEASVQDAEEWLSVGKIRLALEAILAGNRFVLATDRTLQQVDSIQPERIKEELIKLEQNLAESMLYIDESSDLSKSLLTQSQEMYQHAQAALDHDQIILVKEYLQISKDLLEKSKKNENN